MAMYVYALSPIDFWEPWRTEDEYLAAISQDSYNGAGWRKAYDAFKDAALKLAQKAGWEGDMRQGPFIGGLPMDLDDARYCLAWKQDNNGTTFVAAPVELPWLGKPAARG
jgi:hypothetical protein